MGRHKSIDRDEVLDLAEKIITEKGAAALTIAAVAEAAGITKGGVQSCFGTKEALIRTMLQRWSDDEQRQFESEVSGDASITERVAGHARITQSSGIANERAAGLLIALLQSPQYLDTIRAWYAKRMAGLDADGPEARRARLAFLAVEGAFCMRYFGLSEMSGDQWDRTFKDIASLLNGTLR